MKLGGDAIKLKLNDDAGNIQKVYPEKSSSSYRLQHDQTLADLVIVKRNAARRIT
jgi:hypothetical protein